MLLPFPPASRPLTTSKWRSRPAARAKGKSGDSVTERQRWCREKGVDWWVDKALTNTLRTTVCFLFSFSYGTSISLDHLSQPVIFQILCYLFYPNLNLTTPSPCSFVVLENHTALTNNVLPKGSNRVHETLIFVALEDQENWHFAV